MVAGASICGHGSVYAQTSTWKIDPAHSSVNFEISHLAVSHVHGSLTNVSGVVELNDKAHPDGLKVKSRVQVGLSPTRT
jgi:polyisoprenoid-binding protein YceI